MRQIFQGGTVLDIATESRRLLDVVVEGERIIEIAPQVSVLPSDLVIDVSRKWLLPGLTNCHAHLGWDGIHDLEVQSLDTDEIGSWRAARNVRRSLAAGLTTLRDLGMNGVGIYAKQAVDRSISPFIRLLPVGRAITMTGGHTWWACREADGIEDCRAAVREQAKAGAAWIKIMGTHYWPQMPPDRGPVCQFSTAELETLVSEAHSLGLKVTACIGSGEAARRVIEAGVDCIEHGAAVSEATLNLMLERKVWLVTTFSPLVLQARDGLAAGMPRAAVEHRQRQIGDGARFDGLRTMVAAGVPVAFGTDAGSPLVPHGEIVPELQFMVQVGVCRDAWAALRAITLSAAELLALDYELGSLEVGKLADVVVVNGDPVADLENLRDIADVYIGGTRAA
ncbi:MAG: amidohydrolase family protein [Candidatus Dormiibacterota bacterium]